MGSRDLVYTQDIDHGPGQILPKDMEPTFLFRKTMSAGNWPIGHPGWYAMMIIYTFLVNNSTYSELCNARGSVMRHIYNSVN